MNLGFGFALDLYNRSISRAFILGGADETRTTARRDRDGLRGDQFDDQPKEFGSWQCSFLEFHSDRGSQGPWIAKIAGAHEGSAHRWPQARSHAIPKQPPQSTCRKNLKVPVSFIAVFSDLYGQLLTGRVDVRLEIAAGWGDRTIEIQGQTLPIELETTSSLAYMLTESPPWSRELAGFFQGDLARSGDGLFSLEPYTPGKIPVILVHGTASSSGRWADIVNDLTNDPRIRDRYQFLALYLQHGIANPLLGVPVAECDP